MFRPHRGRARAAALTRQVMTRRLFASIAATAALSLTGASAAPASTITVGSVLPFGSTPTEFEQVRTLFNTALPEKGANLVSPVNGAIVRWRVQDAEGGPFYLRVLRPNGKGGYTAVGTSNPVTPTKPGLQTFSTNLPIRAGDLIGIDPSSPSDKIGVVEVAGASYGQIFPPPFDGATVAPSGSVSGKEIELSAEVQPTPTVTGLSASLGPIGGGTEVTITGTDLNGASAVEFGELPAAGYTVKSDTQIVAVAPPSTEPGQVDVTVTTVAGTSATNARSDGFSYQACVVPNLKRYKLGAAKSRLRGHGCKPGIVKKLGEATVKTGIVKSQNPAPGKILKPGSKVNFDLGVERKKKENKGKAGK